MAHFDPQRGEIVVRIVYDGLATAGKTANLKSLYSAFTSRSLGELYLPAETRSGRTLYFDWLELSTGRVDDWPIRCQLLTVPGQFAFAERRFRLLRQIDGVVLVCASTAKGVESARLASAFLARALASTGNTGVPIVFQANKQDLSGALSPAEVAARLGLGPERPILPACATSGDGVRVTLIKTLDLVRESLRDKLRRGGIEALERRTESAEDLYTSMLSEEGLEDPEAVRALEAALGDLAGPGGSPSP